MDSKIPIQHNKLMQLENSMVMYGIYNAETLEQLINTVHCIHNTTSSNEKLFTGQENIINTLTAICKCTRHSTLLHKFIAVSENCKR